MVRAAALALLLALALPMGVSADPTAGGPEAPSVHDVATLTLNGSTSAGFATTSLDVSTAMTVQREATASRLDRYALDERLENAASTEARQQLVVEAASTLEIRIDALRADERQLRAAFAAGEIDADTLLRRQARILARASELLTTLDRLQGHAAAIPQFSLNGRIQLLNSKLIGYRGPVRERALATATGAAPATRVAVAASTDGVVLSMLDGTRYVREAYRADQRTPNRVSRFTLDAAASRAFELYPVAYNRSQDLGFGQNIDGDLGGNLYLVSFSMPAGTIDAYLDDGTRNVFFEVQERRVDRLGPRPAVEGAANGTRLTVNRTYAGGPLQVTVVDNATGEPRQTTVVVADHSVETGSEGTAWTLGPSGVFQVTAVGPDGNVTVTVRPLAATPVIAEG